MPGMMDGKVAVVTGAGGGIGREIALMMAAAGAKVIVADIGASLTGEGGSASPAEQTKQMIAQAGGTAEICTESVAAWGSAQKIIQSAMDHFGQIDAVVNNAGILRDVIFHKMTEDDWLSVIAVHLNGSFFVSRAAAEHYRKQESGTFVHMSSTSGLIGNFGQANYAAAKLGMTALSKSIALDMQRYNVRSNCIAPFAWSRMTSSIPATTPEQQARVAKIQTDDARQERADGGLPVVRRIEGRHRPGVRLPDERDDPFQLSPSHPYRAPRGRLDPGDNRRSLHPGDEGRFHAAGPFWRSVRLGPGLIEPILIPAGIAPAGLSTRYWMLFGALLKTAPWPASSMRFLHVHTIETFLTSPLAFDVATSGIDRDVVRHSFIRVQHDGSPPTSDCLGLGKIQQLASVPKTLPIRPHGDVVQQQMPWPIFQHQKTGDHAIILQHPKLFLRYPHGVIVQHRTWRRPHDRHVPLVGRQHDVPYGGGLVRVRLTYHFVASIRSLATASNPKDWARRCSLRMTLSPANTPLSAWRHSTSLDSWMRIWVPANRSLVPADKV